MMKKPLQVLVILLFSGACCLAVARDNMKANGEQLLAEACTTSCHGLHAVTSTIDGRPGWEDTVHKMVVMGAQLNGEEIELLVDYLARHYGPSQGQMKTGPLPPNAIVPDEVKNSDDVSLPDGEGKALVQGLCVMCHDAGRIVANRRTEADWQGYTENMLKQGNLSATEEQIQAIVAYLTKHFGASELRITAEI